MKTLDTLFIATVFAVVTVWGCNEEESNETPDPNPGFTQRDQVSDCGGFAAELEHDSGQLRYLNAGHNPPFLLRESGTEKLPPSSYPLGMLGDASYDETTLELQPGETILAYTDGVTEAANEDGEEFGMERLEALVGELRGLSPEETGARVLREVDRFIGSARLADDLSIAVIQRE